MNFYFKAIYTSACILAFVFNSFAMQDDTETPGPQVFAKGPGARDHLVPLVVNDVELGLTLLDTGATITTLCLGDALRAGIPTASIEYGKLVCASGRVVHHAVITAKVSIGKTVLESLIVHVSKRLERSLVGMNFLRKTASFSINLSEVRLYADDVKHSVRDGMVSYPKADGHSHFYLPFRVNNRPAGRGMVDTGASHIILHKAAAKASGIDLESLVYNQEFTTAAGSTKYAKVIISFSIKGRFARKGGAAYVSPTLGETLIGMEFFNALEGGYEIRPSEIVLFKGGV